MNGTWHHTEGNYDRSTWTADQISLADCLKLDMYIYTHRDGSWSLCGTCVDEVLLSGDDDLADLSFAYTPEHGTWEVMRLSTFNYVGFYDTKEEMLVDFPEIRVESKNGENA